MECLLCGKDMKGTRRTMFCVDCMPRSDRKYRKRAWKQLAVKYKGGSCSVCGYDKCAGALDFHHIEPELKEAGITEMIFSRSGNYWEELKTELDKCILICKNCHSEIHYGEE